jgi:hypothetical protein
MGKSLHVSDLTVDTKKFHVLNHAEEAIVTVHAPKKAIAVDETTVVAPSEVPVATEKKEDTAE